MARGGRTVYFGEIGENSSTLTNYFERNGAHHCPAEANPAEWMLEVIGAAPGASSDKDWPAIWNASPEKAAVKAELASMAQELSKLPRAPSAAGFSEFAVPFHQQLWLCTQRVFEQYWRTPTYIYAKVLMCTCTGLFVGFSFWMSPNSIQGLQNQMFSIFMVITIFGNLAQQMMPHFVLQRSLYEVRERPSKAYSWKAFMLANIIVELPWQALMSVLTFVPWYYAVGFYRNAQATDTVTERGGLMFLLVLAFYLWTSTFSHLIIAGVDGAENGGNLANLFFTLCLIFCGVLASPDVFPRFWIFVYRLSPLTYLMSAMISTGVANSKAVCSSLELLTFQSDGGMTCGEYMADYIKVAGGRVYNPDATSDCRYCTIEDTNVFLNALGAKYDDRWRNFGLLIVYIVFNVFAALGMYWLARVPKGAKAMTVDAADKKKVVVVTEEENAYEPKL